MLVEKGTTGSTNDDARELALRGAAHGSAVLAHRQAAGRGRDGRVFASPEGGLYLSVVLRPRRAPASWGLLPLVVGVAVVDELRARGVAASLKWPNDVLVGRAKLGGVLVESRLAGEPFAVAGVGLNLERGPVEGATALAEHGVRLGARALAEPLVARLVARVDAWDAGGDADALADVRARCATLGRKVQWEKGSGVAVDVAEDGALVVERPDGAREAVRAGDVRLVGA